jgi:NADH-quinone oxidoreductase subunit H
VTPLEIILAIVRAFAVFLIVMLLMPLLTWMERKGAAYIQDRRGPNRAEILGFRFGGLLHVIADAVKLITKETVIPREGASGLMLAAPVVTFVAALLPAIVIPFSGEVDVSGTSFALQVANPQAGLVVALALASLSAYGLLLAGFASNTTYAFTGALRAAAQFMSYELAIGLAAVALFLTAGSLSIPVIVADQGSMPWMWNAARQPVAFVVFFTALFAAAHRLPFDLPEAESELVAGYSVEYSGIRFGLFPMAEYTHIVVSSALMAALFFSGWNLPFVSEEYLAANATAVAGLLVPMLGLALVIVGAGLVQSVRRFYGDRRDREPILLGAPLLLAGFALIIFPVAKDGWADAFSWIAPATILAVGCATMLVKTIAIASIFIRVRWTLPRFRYDQLLALGWKGLLPIAMANAVVTAVVIMYR